MGSPNDDAAEVLLWLFIFAIGAISASIGYIFGTAYGWLTAGVLVLIIAILCLYAFFKESKDDRNRK